MFVTYRIILLFLVFFEFSSANAANPEPYVQMIINELPSLKPVTWSADREKVHLVVFIDNQCVYCSYLVKHVRDYTEQGITMSFLTVTPANIKEQVTADMSRVWCSPSPQKSLVAAMNGFLPSNDATAECIDQIKRQAHLANLVGVTATPVMVDIKAPYSVFLGSVRPDAVLLQTQVSQNK